MDSNSNRSIAIWMAELPCHVAELILDFSRNVAESDHRESTVHACPVEGRTARRQTIGGQPPGGKPAVHFKFEFRNSKTIQAGPDAAGPTTQLNSCARPIDTC